MPKNLAYSLRFPSELRTSDLPSYYRPEDMSWQTNVLFGADGYTIKYADEDDAGPPSYYKEGFLAIQNAIAKSFVAMNNATMPEILPKRFPTPKHLRNAFASDFQFLMPLFFLMSLNYTFMNTVRFISIEKEKQLKEAMKIMGLASWMHYLSWFVRTLIMLFISMTLITILLTVIFQNAPDEESPLTNFAHLFSSIHGLEHKRPYFRIPSSFVCCSFSSATASV